jgi:RNA polymerase sigma-70 factor (ECF subfamily)
VPNTDINDSFRLALEGDHDAFDRLRKELEPSVRRFVRRLAGDLQSEDEVAQDAFYALFKNLGRLNGVEHVRPFLFRVVRNLCYDELRRKGRFDIVSLDEAREDGYGPVVEAVDRRPGPDDEVHWMLLYENVRQTMMRLPEMQRQALILFSEEDMSYEQIAEAMATDVGTVKSRIHYGRKNLQKLLDPRILESLRSNT